MPGDSKITIHTKAWFQDENGKTIFGFGRLRILEAIERTGSINAAAKDLKMGYRSMWGKIKKTEERLGQPLLIRRKGGVAGGKSELSPFGKEMVQKFKLLEDRVGEEAQRIYDEIFES